MERPARHVGPAHLPGQTERHAQLGRAVGELRHAAIVERHSSGLRHDVQALPRLRRSDEHSLRRAFVAGDDVEAQVHPVDGVDVGVAGRAPHDLVPRGASSPEGVRGGIGDPAVGLRLHHHAGEHAFRRVMDQHLSQEVRRHFQRRPGEEVPVQRHHRVHERAGLEG